MVSVDTNTRCHSCHTGEALADYTVTHLLSLRNVDRHKLSVAAPNRKLQVSVERHAHFGHQPVFIEVRSYCSQTTYSFHIRRCKSTSACLSLGIRFVAVGRVPAQLRQGPFVFASHLGGHHGAQVGDFAQFLFEKFLERQAARWTSFVNDHVAVDDVAEARPEVTADFSRQLLVRTRVGNRPFEASVQFFERHVEVQGVATVQRRVAAHVCGQCCENHVRSVMHKPQRQLAVAARIGDNVGTIADFRALPPLP